MRAVRYFNLLFRHDPRLLYVSDVRVPTQTGRAVAASFRTVFVPPGHIRSVQVTSPLPPVILFATLQFAFFGSPPEDHFNRITWQYGTRARCTTVTHNNTTGKLMARTNTNSDLSDWSLLLTACDTGYWYGAGVEPEAGRFISPTESLTQSTPTTEDWTLFSSIPHLFFSSQF